MAQRGDLIVAEPQTLTDRYCVERQALQVALGIRILRNDQLEPAGAVICALPRAAEAKDSNTEGHFQRLALYAVAIGERILRLDRARQGKDHGLSRLELVVAALGT